MENPKVRPHIRLSIFVESISKRKHSKKRKEKPQLYFQDVDSSHAAMNSPSPLKSPNKKDDEIEYFDNFVLGGTLKARTVHKNDKKLHNLIRADDPDYIEFNDDIAKSKT
jgi:hypothetical protein